MRLQRPEVGRYYSIWYDRHEEWVQACPQRSVLLACVADADDVANIAQTELEQLVGHDTRGVAEAEQAVVGEDRSQAHGIRVQNAFVAKIGKRRMAMYDLDVFPDEDLPQYWEAREDGWECCRAIDDPMRQMIDLDSVREVSDTGARRVVVSVRYDDHSVPSIDQFLYTESAY